MADQQQAADTSSSAPAPPSQPQDAGPSDTSSTPGCPICEFIEAGPCGDQHKVWVSCRGKAKEEEVDYVSHCADTFRSFFGCMLSHQDYYKPFLEAFHVDTDLSQAAIDKANSSKQPPQAQAQAQQQTQQAQQTQPADPPPQQQQQHLGSSSAGGGSGQPAQAQKPGGSSRPAAGPSQHTGAAAVS